MKSFFPFLIVLFVLFSCVQKNKVPVAPTSEGTPAAAPGTHQVKVEEVVQTTNYTYLKVSENGADKWIAVTRQEAAPGETYYYGTELEMRNFESKELKRTFESVYFVSDLSKQPVMGNTKMPASQGKVESAKAEGISVAPAAGVSIADLYAKAGQYAGKTLKMKGQVVKVNDEIMDRNWVHIQDGTGSSGDFDLTITTHEKVEVGATVTFEGTIATKKDFGYGYFYDVILEDGKLVQ